MICPRPLVSVVFASLIFLLYWTNSSAQSDGFTSTGLSSSHETKTELPYFTREKVEKTFDGIKDTLTAFKEVREVADIFKNLTKFAAAAPGVVGAFFSIVNIVLAFLPQEDPVLNAVQEGFAEVNRKLDSLAIQVSNLATDVEWFNYVSVYSQDEARILNTWRKLNEFRESSVLSQSEEDKLQLMKMFINYYEYTGTEASVANLYYYLTVSDTSLTKNLNQLLAKKFKCDINKIGKYNLYLNNLLLQGIVVNQFYWKLIGFNPPNKTNKHTDMFNKVKKTQLFYLNSCLEEFEKYMLDDVKEISKALSPDNKKAIADHVKEGLDEKYSWYKWVVLVYNTEDNGKHKLYDMTMISVGKVTVAVGHYDGTDNWDVRCQRITDCKKESIQCGMRHRRYGRYMYVEPDEMIVAFMYGKDFAMARDTRFTSRCGLYGNIFAYHKAKTYKTCKDVNKCGENGKCKPVLDTESWLCECQEEYYGDTCEIKKADVFNSLPSIDISVPNITTIHTKLKMMDEKLVNILHAIKTIAGQ